jgi:hypothetical protein
MKVALLMLIAALGTTAVAQDTQTPAPNPNTQSARKACRSDAMKFCPGKRGNEAAECLRNSDKVSQDCKDALAKLPPAPPPSS